MRAGPETVSVVVPALDEAPCVAAAVRSALAAGADEVVVVDGGSGDGTAAEAARAGARVISSPRGRAAQMNAGAAASSGGILLFLHADTRLPPGAADAVRRALLDPSVAGGAFRVSFEPSPAAPPLLRLLLRAIECGVSLRSGSFSSHTGDQAIFVRRTRFERAGGYEEVPLMEDVRLSAAMRRGGRTVLLRERAVTSARRWEAGGAVRTVMLMWFLRVAHALGMSPERCAEIYGAKR